jgi:hypothetical protein
MIELDHIKELENVVVSSKNISNITATVLLGIYPSQVMDEGATK